MATFISLLNLTEQGAKDFRQSPERASKFKAAAQKGRSDGQRDILDDGEIRCCAHSGIAGRQDGGWCDAGAGVARECEDTDNARFYRI